MGRLIYRDEALLLITDLPVNSTDAETVQRCVEVISNMPTVDAVPVVHGHWKEDPSGYGFWICSACGFVSEASAANMLYKFCPVCGAKMDGKDET